MSALIPILNRDGRQAVGGRDLHAFLGLGRDYTNWFKAMAEYGFIEGQDFTPIRAESTGGRPSVDHAMTLDMAKELAMIQRTPKGKEARQYFIEVEKRAKSAQPAELTRADLARMVLAAEEEKAALAAKLAEDAPKVLFADSVAASESTILVGELAKILKGNGLDIGANRLFELLRNEGYLIKRKGSDWNMPTQYAMDLGLFKIKESTQQQPDGTVRITKTPKVTGKGQAYFINRYITKALVAA